MAGEQASLLIHLDEADTRRLIDAQLRAAGWEADTEALTFAKGARPAKGRNIAIAMVAGGVFMAVAGGLAGAFDLMLGMGIGMGVGLGFVTGLLMGLVGAMQAGTRIPKPALRALEARLAAGGAILVVELDAAKLDAATELLEEHGAVAVETC